MFGFLNRDAKKMKKVKEEINMNNLPKHIAIIMDGNGRWAQKKMLPRTAGHREGVKRVREIVETCGDIGIQYLTLYAFSTENWNRPNEEIEYLMQLMLDFLRKELDTLHRNNVKIRILGNIEKLDSLYIKEINKAVEKTKENERLILNIALNYGGRDEIIRAFKLLMENIIEKNIGIDKVNEESLKRFLYTEEQPDPNLLIRTSGELRISNFLLYQIAYSEFWFTDINWPDFTKKYLYEAIIDYQARNRKFGGL